MHNAVTIGEIFFKIAVFSLLIYRGIDWFTATVIPWFKEIARQDNDKLTALLEREKLLTTSTGKLTTQISQQAQLLTILEHKIQRWQETLTHDKNTIEDEQRTIAIAHAQLIRKQEEQLVIRKTILAVVPIAFIQAQKSLLLSNQEHYLNSLIDDIASRPTP